MIWIPATMFETPKLEEKFRYLVAQPFEIGGMLLYTINSQPDFCNRREWKALIGSDDWVYVIRSWMLFPNTSKTPIDTWRTWDFEKAIQIAELTAKSMGLHTIHFHSHPTATNTPSQADLAFMCHNCRVCSDFSEAAIAQSRPMRLNVFAIQTSQVGQRVKADLIRNVYWSWREKRFAPYRP